MLNQTEIIIFMLFFFWAWSHGRECPCDHPGEYECVRDEVWGVQLNHFVIFFILGMMFPNRFWPLMFIGLIWELWELYITQYPEFVYSFGGCLTRRGVASNKSGRVYAGERKYHNPIDEALGLEAPRWHTWHGSAAELIPNVLGFITGSMIVHWIKNNK